ncbi:hypothetical protein ALO46_102237 [Pseudomonas syringae pv. solidagae]|uniref:Uncharacterized protein n=1 Tax=Pseudomonas syringae pv. solidagae TaxID=264458 RepID=A0A0P9ZAE9_PSESX|nr:hypothetical protein ALO46_102237 [Pseudomonas syringae pv. solidagae]RMT49028.1 hypothetical protein ALP48_102193 [Pseudomonas syringae pv. solidagae]
MLLLNIKWGRGFVAMYLQVSLSEARIECFLREVGDLYD